VGGETGEDEGHERKEVLWGGGPEDLVDIGGAQNTEAGHCVIGLGWWST
jgi:hypothetical protein